MDETEFSQQLVTLTTVFLFLPLSVEFQVPERLEMGCSYNYFLCYVCHVLLFYGVAHFRGTQN